MKALTSAALLAAAALSAALPARGEDRKDNVIRIMKWDEVPLPAGSTLQNKPGASPTLLVKHDSSQALQLPLWKLDKPGITKKCYALRGKLRYKDVAGVGYLELWNVFPPQAAGQADLRAFSRTLAEQGAFGRITGTSDWRDVFIPFDATDATQPPKALELNLSLAGAGEVEITSLSLQEFDDREVMWSMVTGVFQPGGIPQAGWLPVAAGGVLAVIGILAWILARRGRQVAEMRRMKAMDAMP